MDMAKVEKRGRGRPRLPGVWVRLGVKLPKLLREAIEAEAKMTGMTMQAVLVLILESWHREKAGEK